MAWEPDDKTPSYSVEVWEERDRLHIGLLSNGHYIADWWDDDARQMFEDGFFERGRNLESSVIAYARQMGLLASATPPGAQS